MRRLPFLLSVCLGYLLSPKGYLIVLSFFHCSIEVQASYLTRWKRPYRLPAHSRRSSPAYSLHIPDVPSIYETSLALEASSSSAYGHRTPITHLVNATSHRIFSGRRSALVMLREARQRVESGSNLTQENCDRLLGECVAQDEWDSVLDVLDLMNQQGLTQVKSTYRACLQSCFGASNAASSQEILNAMTMAGFPPDPVDLGLAVATMCRCVKSDKSWCKSALQIVQQSDDLPIAAYDAVLSCMDDEFQWKDAIQLLQRMERGSTKPVVSTYRLAIESCIAAQQGEHAVQVLQSCIRNGLRPTVYSFELVISALSKKVQWRRAIQLLDIMDNLKVPATVVCYNAVLSSLSKAREFVQAKNVLVRMRRSGVQPNVVSFNNVLSTAAHLGMWKEALSVLDQCHREPGVTPDIYTYTNAIRACAKGGSTRKALVLLQVVKDKKLPIDSYCYTAAIEACAKGKMCDKALELLAEMEENGIEPSGVTYSVAITACGNGGQWQKALDLLDVMRKKNLSINLITYNAAITAVAKAAKQSTRAGRGDSQLWPKVKHLLDQISLDGLHPDGFSFSSAISCCGAEARWQEALTLLEQMEEGGPRTRPNKIAYSAAISSCGKAGQVDIAVNLFRRMRDQGISADLVAYNSLLSALRASKRSDVAFELWSEMVGRTQSPSTALATARSDRATRPDIITVTNAIAAMTTEGNTEDERRNVDLVFSEAAKLGIVLHNDSLDSKSEIDLTGMSFPVARAACRFILNQLAPSYAKGEISENLSFITGVGVGKGQRRPDEAQRDDAPRCLTTLREYVKEVLLADFNPPLRSSTPARAQGIVQIEAHVIRAWARSNLALPS